MTTRRKPIRAWGGFLDGKLHRWTPDECTEASAEIDRLTAALAAEKVVSQEHFDYWEQERIMVAAARESVHDHETCIATMTRAFEAALDVVIEERDQLRAHLAEVLRQRAATENARARMTAALREIEDHAGEWTFNAGAVASDALDTPPEPPAPEGPVDFDEITRRVMGEINACAPPGTPLAHVPTLFAFGPINRALRETRGTCLDGQPPDGDQTCPQGVGSPAGISCATCGQPMELRAVCVLHTCEMYWTGLRESSGWQPIETAPKDGTVIDIWCSSPDGVDQWRDVACSWDRHRSLWVSTRGQWDCATHWMPLPEAPASGA